MTPERYLKSKIRKDLIVRGAYVYAPVPGGMGSATLDILACLRGRFLAIEAKAEGKKPTVRQKTTMEEINTAGGIAFYCDSFDSYLRFMTYKGLGTAK